jgi:hypothetical protein
LLGADDIVEPGKLLLEDFAIEEEDRGQRLPSLPTSMRHWHAL